MVTLVFLFRIDTKEEVDGSLKESISGCVTIKSEIRVPLLTQGICDLLTGERRKKLTA